MDKNTQRFIDLINGKLTTLIGKKIGVNFDNAEAEIYDALRDWNKEIKPTYNGYITNLYRVRYNHPHSELVVSYNGFGIASIVIKKTKGDTHYNYFYSHTDYYYKSFEVKPFTRKYNGNEEETILEKMNGIDRMLEANNRIKQQKLEKARYLFNMIKTEINATSDSQVREFIQFMYDNRYKLDKE